MLKSWQERGFYQRIRAARRGAPRFVLHDGPPYANGDIHIGPRHQQDPEGHHRQEQDAVGFDAPYVPGWDCHGMPIEVQIEKQHGKNLPPQETQRLAPRLRGRADRAAEAGFPAPRRARRLGPPLPHDGVSRTRPTRSARSAKLLAKGYVYRGLKPVNWCFDCGSALAEAEVEYENRRDIAIDVGLPVRRAGQGGEGVRPAAAAGRAWLCRDLDDDAVDAAGKPGAQRAPGARLSAGARRERGLLILAADLRERCLEALRSRGAPGARRVRGSGARAHQLPASRSTTAWRRSISAST